MPEPTHPLSEPVYFHDPEGFAELAPVFDEAQAATDAGTPGTILAIIRPGNTREGVYVDPVFLVGDRQKRLAAFLASLNAEGG